MPAAAMPIRFSRLERLAGQISRLRAQTAHNKLAARYSREGRIYRPLAGVCGDVEMEIALSAAKRADAGKRVSFDDALAELRRGTD